MREIVEYYSKGPIRMKDALLLTLWELVGKEISADQLLRRIVDVMAQELGAERATIFWLDHARKELISIAGHLPEIEEIRVPLDQGVAGEVARSGKVINISDVNADNRIWRAVDQETGYHTHTMLAGPLRSADGGIIGVVQFLNKDGRFDRADEAKLEELSRQAALLLNETTIGRAGQRAAQELELGAHFNRIIGNSEPMRKVFKAIRRVAPTQASVLLRGESGCGKTLLRVLFTIVPPVLRGHLWCSIARRCPRIWLRMSSLATSACAYTGATGRATGKVDAAMGGTLFLDEVGDLPLTIQGKLLGLLQERTFSRVGGNQTHRADIRVVAATNRDLEAMVKSGAFRQDLYYRLRVVELEVPPLRERGLDDIEALAHFFLGEFSRRHGRSVHGISEAAMRALVHHPWPGNVRELEHCIESATIFCEGNEILEEDLSLSPSTRVSGNPFADEPTLSELEERYIEWLLERHDGNRSECARILNIGRNTLIRKISNNPFDS